MTPERRQTLLEYFDKLAKEGEYAHKILRTLLGEIDGLKFPRMEFSEGDEAAQIIWGYRKSAGPCKQAVIHVNRTGAVVFTYFNGHTRKEHRDTCQYPTSLKDASIRHLLEFRETEEEKVIEHSCSMCGLLPQEPEEL